MKALTKGNEARYHRREFYYCNRTFPLWTIPFMVCSDTGKLWERKLHVGSMCRVTGHVLGLVPYLK